MTNFTFIIPKKSIKFLVPIFLLTLSPLLSFSQNLFPDDGVLFNSGVLPRVDILIHPDSLAEILAPGNEESNHEFRADFIFDSGAFRDTVEEIGFRLRGNTSRYAAKKSFKVSFNTYDPGRKFQGVEKLNINGEHNDPTIARSKTSWDIMRLMGVPAPRANHVKLYINDEYFGLYANVEHIDEEFVELRYGNNGGNLYKCLYPADLIYQGANPELYKQEIFGRRPYDLKTNTAADDYTDLANFIDILNNVSIEDLPCQLEQVFNVNTYLKAIVADILIANWDGPIYNKNNFYLYRNTFTDQFEYIPFDLDNTIGISWFSTNWATRNIYSWSHSEPRPLYERLLEVPEYRNRFSYYMNQAIETFFNESYFNAYLDNLKALMDDAVLNDPLHGGDYGYTFDDYEMAWEEAIGAHVVDGLKPFINTRSESSAIQIDLQDISPIITNIQTNTPDADEDILINCHIEEDSGISSVQICFQIDFQSNITCVDLFDDGMHNDSLANDGIYGAIIPPLNGQHIFNFYIEVTDDNNQIARQPDCVYQQLTVGSIESTLYINEFMANNESTIADEAGEYDDWIELYNGGSESIFLGDKYLTDKLDNPGKWALPQESIGPGEFILIWADEDGEQGIWHANFKLSASGEAIGLYQEESGNFIEIDKVEFGEQSTDIAVGRLPNGTGPFQELNPTPGFSNEPVDVNESIQDTHLLNVFPNPTSGWLRVEANCEDCELQINNLLGQKLGQSIPFNRRQEIELKESGLYLILLKKEGRLLDVQKVILK